MIFDVCAEKGSELGEEAWEAGQRKSIGRAVFEGDLVKVESSDAALFNELGSSPASMAAGKAVGALCLRKGCVIEQADA